MSFNKVYSYTGMYNWILQKLRDRGHRLTTPRSTLAHFLIRYEGVFSVRDIARYIPDADRVSIYRAIHLFHALDIVHPVFQKDGEAYYEVHQAEEHKHHIVCDGCSVTATVPCRVPNVRIPGFQVNHHTVAFSGLCKTCVHQS